jgi:ribonuclease-3
MPREDPALHVQEALGHVFRDPTLMRDALTHRSFTNERPDLGPRDNERMEFLGDAVLGLAASTLLWRHYPDAPEGELTRRRADLVCERSLATFARAIGLGEALRLGKGEERSGGRDKPRLLASALEALLAAVYLDAGEAVASRVARAILEPHVESLAPGESDYKTRLQELLQGKGEPAPSYVIVRAEGPDHDRVFFVEVRQVERTLGEGSGRTKLAAEQLAAQQALAQLEAEAG